MTNRPFSWTLFAQAPIVGILRHLTPDEVAAIMPLFVESGLTTVEVTMNTTDATPMIEAVVRQYGDWLNVGAGTVRTEADLHLALDAGAQFIVTPTLNEAIIGRCVEQTIPIFPGAFTPTEIERAWLLGASMVKVYPAGVLGPSYIRDLKAPLNDIKLLPTGGIGLDTMTEYLKAGADGIGMGGQLFDKTLIGKRDWEGLKRHFLAVTRLSSTAVTRTIHRG